MTCSYTWDISEGLSSYKISWTVPLFICRPDRTSTTRSSYSSSPPPAMLMTSKFNLIHWLSCINFTCCPNWRFTTNCTKMLSYSIHDLYFFFFIITCLYYLSYRYMELLSSYLLPIMMTIAWLAAISVATKNLVYDRENGQEEVN